jgi:hypothetical protein
VTDIEVFFDLITWDSQRAEEAEREILAGWENAHAVMLLELYRVARWGPMRQRILALLERATGESFGTDAEKWWKWVWETDPGTHPDYADFKAALYSSIDPSFRDYFDGSPAATIRLDEIRWGGVERDGIPPLDLPKLIPAARGRYLADDNVVFGIAVAGRARAYPKRILGWHEMVKDTIGGEHFTGVYCTLCGTMIVYRSTVDGTRHELGTSGFLYRSNKLMYDHVTRSLWSTLTGGPVLGPLANEPIELEPQAIVTTTWGEWRRRHPETLVLSLDTGYDRDYGEGVAYREYFGSDDLMFSVPESDDRLRNKDEVLALRLPGVEEVLAFSVEFLSAHTVHHDSLGPISFVVFTDPTGASRAFQTDGQRFRRWDGERTVWDEQGTPWVLSETTLTGPEEVALRRLPAHRAFWFGWYAQYPETRLVR